MYLSSCRKSLLKKTGAKAPVLPPKKKPAVRKGRALAVDGRMYLTDEGEGYYMLWDQRDYPAALPVARIDEEMARTILENGRDGKRLLKDLVQFHEKRLEDQRLVTA